MKILSKLTPFLKFTFNVVTKNASGFSARREQRKELEKIEKSKLDELNDRHASRKFDVKGVTFENRQHLLNTIARKHGSEGVNRIEFIPEPDNKHDPNAIKIIFEGVGHIGYVPKERAVSISKLLEKGTYDIKWDIIYDHWDGADFSDDSYSDGRSYMEVRLYSQQ